VIVSTASSPDQAGALAATAVLEALVAEPRAALGVATGGSPQPLYASLARLVGDEGVDLRSRTAYALDEYIGMPPDHPESYHAVVARDVTGPLRLRPELVHVPNGAAEDPVAAAAAYEEAVRAHGPRVQVIGIGANGHIGFNEPGSARDSVTRVVELTAETRAANSRFFASVDEVPTHAISQGIGTILAASTIVLIAHGATKAEAVAAAITGPETTDVPASFLRSHPDVRVFLDEASASLLPQHTH
jgi:glucosamine-6-phosphate deaminase